MPETTRELFLGRKLFKSAVQKANMPAPIDFWHSHILYGRVDDYNMPVVLNEKFLKQLHTEIPTSNIFVLNCVADAYEDLRAYYNGAADRGKISIKGSSYGNLEPSRGWVNPAAKYETYMNDMFQVFMRVYVTRHKLLDVCTSFPEFLEHYKRFVSATIKEVPATYYKFIGTKYSTPLISGLVVEVSDANHQDDYSKIKNFYNDRLGQFFINSAKRFGFRVDANAPWRLVADISSPAFTDYLKRYDVTPATFFDNYYIDAADGDLAPLKSYMWRYYNTFCDQAKNCEPLVEEDYNHFYDEQFWLNFYISLRSIEEGKWTRPELKSILETAASIEKQLDITSALRYTNKKIYNSK